MNHIARKTGLATMALTLSLGMAACGGSEEEPASASDTSSESSSETPSEEPMEEESAASDAAEGTFGEGCAAIPTDESDPGSFAGMATEPVATAASGNPLLKTLVAAVTKAGLVDTLNSAEGITVFAPTDEAFAKIPKKTLNAVLADKKTLTAILTHHVVPETLTPDNLAGTFTTLNKDELTVEGSGDMFTADTEEAANVICGNISTANAKVYVIDTVMMPQM
ncbi:fasciclin domain-containing protein [Nocardioides piscis]|uniref:Fasciclin domain-containing protein n=1 Tax=Nocardioides piscis TaxID=2714938 RepID=A0A6G7YDR5_9ACTN|nr:fasciclin domain-containing protein [Nocardioides piscis]QIK75044.1 fasciclin domain-containing protein [Nocardioides piscis]